MPFDEIIVVDDGSTDGSAELLASRYARQPRVQIVAKCNQGQLSCFNEGFERAGGDLVFFLDADDFYAPEYVARALEVYHRDPHVDFVFCGHRQFGQRESVQLEHAEDRDLGYSVVLTAQLRNWIGAPTSCLSMRRWVLESILPLPFLESWRTRADDCLIFGASLAGARKYYLSQPLVHYRVHANNQFFGRPQDKLAGYRRRLAVNVLFEHLERRLSYDAGRLAELHHREFCTIAKPTFKQLRQYCRISTGLRASLVRRLGCMAEMSGHYLRSALARSAARQAPDLREVPTGPLRVFVPSEDAPSMDEARPARDRRHAA